MSIIREKSFSFAVQIVYICKTIREEHKEWNLTQQLVRSGTAIGALIREAENAQSKADFIHKMSIAQKEANETAYWLELLYVTGYIDNKKFKSIIQEQSEIAKILASIILTAKKNQKNFSKI